MLCYTTLGKNSEHAKIDRLAAADTMKSAQSSGAIRCIAVGLLRTDKVAFSLSEYGSVLHIVFYTQF